MSLVDETGNRYGKYEVIERASNVSNSRAARWLCRCDCGKEKSVRGQHLRNGEASSCGQCHRPSLVLKSGFSDHYLYHTWSNMTARCYNENNPAFSCYGELGIDVYEEWHDPGIFFRWIDNHLGQRPEGYSLDRIDVYGNYEPGNLRWANDLTQVNNRRLVLLSEEEHQLIMRFRNKGRILENTGT